jgi:hypothetical protein
LVEFDSLVDSEEKGVVESEDDDPLPLEPDVPASGEYRFGIGELVGTPTGGTMESICCFMESI